MNLGKLAVLLRGQFPWPSVLCDPFATFAVKTFSQRAPRNFRGSASQFFLISQAFLLPGILLTTCARAQDRVTTALDSLPSIKKIDQVAISPDGAQVAYIIEGRAIGLIVAALLTVGLAWMFPTGSRLTGWIERQEQLIAAERLRAYDAAN